MPHLPDICEFSEIRLSVPRKKIIALFRSHMHLSQRDTLKMRAFSCLLERELNKCLHLKSITERILLKASDYK